MAAAMAYAGGWEVEEEGAMLVGGGGKVYSKQFTEQ
jgi:hypothetical protein